MNLFIDVETIPTQDPRKESEIRGRFVHARDTTHAPKSYKSENAIDGWHAAKEAEAAPKGEEAYRKTALDGSLGEIVTICAALGGGQVETFSRDGDGEAEMLNRYWDWLRKALRRHEIYGDGNLLDYPFRVIGHSAPFDIRFLWQRSKILRAINVPSAWPINERFNGEKIFDTMQAWVGWGNYIKLGKLADILGLESDDTITGVDVWDCYQRGEIWKINHHCAEDVRLARDIFHIIS